MINKDIKNSIGVRHKGFNCFRSVLCSSHFLVPLPLLIHKMLLESYEEDIKQISPGTTNHHNPYRDFCKLSYLGKRSEPRENARASGEARASRASTFHDILRMESLLVGYSLHETVSMPKYSLKQ